MCPEKERYDREDKRRLSYFEMVPGTESIVSKHLSKCSNPSNTNVSHKNAQRNGVDSV